MIFKKIFNGFSINDKLFIVKSGDIIKIYNEEPERWITVHGVHIPVFKGDDEDWAIHRFFKLHKMKKETEERERGEFGYYTKDFYEKLSEYNKKIYDNDPEMYDRRAVFNTTEKALKLAKQKGFNVEIENLSVNRNGGVSNYITLKNDYVSTTLRISDHTSYMADHLGEGSGIIVNGKKNIDNQLDDYFSELENRNKKEKERTEKGEKQLASVDSETQKKIRKGIYYGKSKKYLIDKYNLNVDENDYYFWEKVGRFDK